MNLNIDFVGIVKGFLGTAKNIAWKLVSVPFYFLIKLPVQVKYVLGAIILLLVLYVGYRVVRSLNHEIWSVYK